MATSLVQVTMRTSQLLPLLSPHHTTPLLKMLATNSFCFFVCLIFILLLFFNIYLFVYFYLLWLCRVLVVARGIFVAACGLLSCGIFFFFFLKKFTFFYLFIYDCVESSFLCEGFL